MQSRFGVCATCSGVRSPKAGIVTSPTPSTITRMTLSGRLLSCCCCSCCCCPILAPLLQTLLAVWVAPQIENVNEDRQDQPTTALSCTTMLCRTYCSAVRNMSVKKTNTGRDLQQNHGRDIQPDTIMNGICCSSDQNQVTLCHCQLA